MYIHRDNIVRDKRTRVKGIRNNVCKKKEDNVGSIFEFCFFFFLRNYLYYIS